MPPPRDLLSLRSSRQIFVLTTVVTFLLIGPLGVYLHPSSRETVVHYVADKHAEWFAPSPEVPCDP